jgi:methionine synthase I (cobalamin-dependent)
VEPDKFVSAIQAGADLIEIGNFDSFYAQGRRFEAEEVLALTQKTRSLLPNITLSVTVPHILKLDQQVQLAEELVQAGADIIQTEGGTSSNPRSAGTLGLIEKAAPTLAAAYEISRAVSVPVLCASGLSSVTAPMAIAAGARGVGVGSAINQLDNEVAMVAAVRSLVESLATVSREGVRQSIG